MKSDPDLVMTAIRNELAVLPTSDPDYIRQRLQSLTDTTAVLVAAVYGPEAPADCTYHLNRAATAARAANLETAREHLLTALLIVKAACRKAPRTNNAPA